MSAEIGPVGGMSTAESEAKPHINGNGMAGTLEVRTRSALTEIELSSNTIKQAGNALFTLWLKIGATLLALRLLSLVWPVLVLTLVTLMLVATLNPLVRRL